MLDAQACSCSVSDAYCCCFSFHALFDLHYESCPAKTATAKRLAREIDVLVREVERHLDAYPFLDEYPQWPHHPYILQRMFNQAENAGQKEYDYLRWRGQQQSMPKCDASMEASTVDLVGYKTSREEIFTLYQEVYQVKRAPGAVPGHPEEDEKTCQEILDLLKVSLWHRQGPTQSEEELRQRSMGTKRPVQAEFHNQMQTTYEHFGPLFGQTAGVMQGGPDGGQGCPPSGAGSSCPVGGTHLKTGPLCHSWVVWKPQLIR